MALKEMAWGYVQLLIDGLRMEPSSQEKERARLLSRLAGAYELAALIDRGTVESLASKIGVSEEQAQAGAVLKVQAEDLELSRAQIEKDLSHVDRWWQNRRHQLPSEMVRLLNRPLSSKRMQW